MMECELVELRLATEYPTKYVRHMTIANSGAEAILFLLHHHHSCVTHVRVKVDFCVDIPCGQYQILGTSLSNEPIKT